MLDFNFYIAISLHAFTYKSAKRTVLNTATSKLFENFSNLPLSPFEAACYFGNLAILNDILTKAEDFTIPLKQINSGFSHAIWQGKSEILKCLLDRYDYTFDQVEFAHVRVAMRGNVALAEKINSLTQRDFNHAKSLALLFHELHQNHDVSNLLCAYLPATHEERRTEILNAHRSFITKLEAPNHSNDLQAHHRQNLR